MSASKPEPFAPLPVDTTRDGSPRRTGVEIEFTNLSEGEAARIVARETGGEARQVSTHAWEVEDGTLGTVKVYLDTALAHRDRGTLTEAGLRLGHDLIPVEIVTEPLDRAELGRLDALCTVLREAGAQGSGRGVLYGFGVHLNVQVSGEDAAGITRPLLAYALLEDWIRAADPIDLSRRALPFTDPYPTSLVRDLARAGPDAPPEKIMEIYLGHGIGRNQGLDMLPLLAHLDEDAVARATEHDKALKARPTFHFRLPDSRIDEPDWSLRDEWDRWRTVETVAADAALLDRLAREWLDDHGALTLTRSGWADRCGRVLADHGLADLEEIA